MAIAVVFTLQFAAMAAGALRYGRGCLRAGLRVDADALVVCNPLTERRVPLADAVRFRADFAPQGGNPAPTIMLELRDGSEHRVWALGKDSFVWRAKRDRDRLAPIADELNARLAAARRGTA